MVKTQRWMIINLRSDLSRDFGIGHRTYYEVLLSGRVYMGSDIRFGVCIGWSHIYVGSVRLVLFGRSFRLFKLRPLEG
jgi:hypothetical protein